MNINNMSDEYLSCTICHEKFRNCEDIFCTICGHVFHLLCIRNWLDRANTCPECRAINPTIHRLYLNIADLTNLEGEINTLRNQTQRDAESIAVLRIDFQESTDKQTELQKQLEECVIKCSNLEYECNQKVTELKDQIEQSIMFSSQQQNDLERQLEDYEIKCTNIKIECNEKDKELRSEIEESKNQQFQLTQELEKYMQKCSTMESQLEIEGDQNKIMESEYTDKIRKLEIQLDLIMNRVIDLENQLELAFMEKRALEAQLKLQIEVEPNNERPENSTCDGKECCAELQNRLTQCIFNCSEKERKIADLNQKIQYLTEQGELLSSKLKKQMLQNHTLAQSLKTSKIDSVLEESVLNEKLNHINLELTKSKEYSTQLRTENEKLQRTLLHIKFPFMYENHLVEDSDDNLNFLQSTNTKDLKKLSIASSVSTTVEGANNELNITRTLPKCKSSSNKRRAAKDESTEHVLQFRKDMNKTISFIDSPSPVIGSYDDEHIEPNTAVVLEGVPKNRNPENWVEYVLELAGQAAVQITESDIKKVSFLRTKRRNRDLLVQFQSTVLKNKFLDIRYKIRTIPKFSSLIMHEHISFPQNNGESQNKVQSPNISKAFNESMFQHAKSLKDIKVYSVYCNNKRIFIKRTKCSKPIEITSKAQIDNMKREYHRTEANKTFNRQIETAKNGASSSEAATTSNP